MPGGRATRGVALLVSIFLILLLGRQYTIQTLDVSAQIERIVRGQVIPDLEKQLNVKIEVGPIESDWLSRIVLKDVVVGRDKSLPTGALARAKSVRLNLDLINLALRRKTPLEALRDVTIQGPELYIHRDNKRRWNFDRFLKGPKQQTQLDWNGTVTWTGGRVYYLDESIRSAQKKPLVVDLLQVSGHADVSPGEAIRASAAIQKTLLGSEQRELDPIRAAVSFDLPTKAVAVDAKLPEAPVGYALDYLLPRRQAQVTSGTASGTLQLTFRDGKLVPHGRINLTRLSGLLPLVKGVNRGKQIPIRDLSGPVIFSGMGFTSSGLQLMAAGIPLRLQGQVAIPKEIVFDLQVASNAVDHRRVLDLLPPNSLPAIIKANPLEVNADIKGDLKDWTATGTARVREVRVTSNRLGEASAQLARLAFAVSQQAGQPLRAAARYAFSGVAGQVKQVNGKATEALGQVRYTGGIIQTEAAVTQWAANSPNYGKVSGPILQLTAGTTKPPGPWRGTLYFRGANTTGVNLSSISPLARVVKRTGVVDASLKFWQGSSSNLTVTGPVRLASAVVDDPNIGLHTIREARGNLLLSAGVVRLANLTAQSDVGPVGGEVYFSPGLSPRLLLTASDLQLPVSSINSLLQPRGLALTGYARGTATIKSSDQQAGILEAEYSLKLPQNSLRTGGRANADLRDSSLDGNARYNPVGRAWNARATFRAGTVTLFGGRIGETNLQIPTWMNGARAAGLGIDVVASGHGSEPPNLSGRASLARLAVSGLPLPGANAAAFTVKDSAVVFETSDGGVALPRIVASLGDGRVVGEGAFSKAGKTKAEFLVGDMQAATLQRLLFPESLKQARLAGELNARVSLTSSSAGFVPRAKVVLKGGAIESGEVFWPLDVASGQVELGSGGVVELRDFTLWSRGGRLAVTGRLGPLPDSRGNGFSGRINLGNLRLSDLATLPGLATLKTAAKADGLVSGSFDATIGSQAKITGPVKLRLATLFGLDVTELTTQLTADSDYNGFQLSAENIAGTIEGADISGAVQADTGRNSWHVRLKSTPISAVRVARARSIKPETLPIRGDFSVDTDISGTLREANRFFPRPKEGFVKINTGVLSWRGRPLGSLNADLTAQDGLLQAKQFQLLRATEEGIGSPLVTVTGKLPLSPDDSGLAADVRVDEAPLDFVFEVMGEVKSGLKAAEVSFPIFERVVTFVQALPPGATGKVSAKAKLEGQLKSPTVDVESLTLRDARARVPAGGLSPPAALDAAFTYRKGAVTISRAEFKLKKKSIGPATAEDEDNDTLIQLTDEGRIVPDGPLQLSGQIVNANLAELATWIPALRGRDGRPVLSGGLSEFTISAGGTTFNPEVRGSIEAEKLAFDTYTIDTLRVNRFDIRNGYLSIEPRAIALAKGNFRSITSVSGKIPWDWAKPGPVTNQPMEIHLPFTQDDFALVGLALPALQAAEAEEMSGAIEIRGSVEEPNWSGTVQVKGGKFRLDPLQTALEVGVEQLSGTIRFTNGNQLLIDADDPLRGRFVTARDVKAREVRRARRERDSDAPELDGRFSLKGGITYDPTLAHWVNPREAVTRQRYDLTLTIEKGEYTSPLISGVRNADLAVIWRTGPAPYEQNQNVRWMFAAEGNAGKGKKAGTVRSIGFLRLDPEVALRPQRLGVSRALDFSGEQDFANFAVYSKINLDALPDRRCQIELDRLLISSKELGYGVLDGRLVLDNQESQQRAPEDAVNLQRVGFTDRLRSYRRGFQLLGVSSGDRFRRSAQLDGPTVPLRELQPPEAREEEILRLGGSINLSDAQVGAVPAGGGIPVRLSLLPAAPLFDIRIVLAENVTVAVATLRASLDGTIIIGGTPQDPQVYGTLATIEGQVRFPGARTRLEEGSITVSASRDPALDILQTRAEVDVTARGTVNQYDLTLRVRGPLVVGDSDAQNLRVDVTTDPPLSQSEAFAQLLGTGTRTASGADVDQAYGKTILQVLSAPLFSGVERSIASALGLTAINFDYRFDSSIAVEFSKNLGNRTIVSYRRSIAGATTNGGPQPYQVRLDYRLKGNLLIGVQTDEQSLRKVTLQKTWRF